MNFPIHRSSSNVSSSPSLLKELYEIPINTLSTEKSYYLIDKDILASQQNDLKCFYCGKVMGSRAGRVIHEKKHRKDIKKEKRQKTEARRRSIISIYRCEVCGEEFRNKGSFTKHGKKHKKIKCNGCNKTFTDIMDYEWHDVYENKNNLNEYDRLSMRTRSKSRLSCRSRAKSKERAKSCDPIMSFSPVSDMFKTGSVMQFSIKTAPCKRLRDELNSDSMDDSDNSEIADTYFEEDEALPNESIYNFEEGAPCPENGCNKVFSGVDWLTLHEMEEHKKLALFRCPECRKRYTTSANLEKHKLIHYQYVHVQCVLCNTLQPGRDIVIHQKQHQKHSIVCNICGMQFLNKFTFEDHQTRPHLHAYPKKIEVLIRVKNTCIGKMTMVENFGEFIGDFSFNSLLLEDYNINIISDLETHLPWRC